MTTRRAASRVSVPAPTAPEHATTKGYVDELVAGLGGSRFHLLTFDGIWPERPDDDIPAIFMGGAAPTEAPSDAREGDYWLPSSEPGGLAGGGGGGGSVAWETGITGKPATFPPSSHTHAVSDVSGLDSALEGKEPAIAPGANTTFWRGDKTWHVLAKSDVGLGNVDNTSDADKPVSTATQEALDTKVGDDDDRLSDERTPLDDSVSTDKIADESVTAAKLAPSILGGITTSIGSKVGRQGSASGLWMGETLPGSGSIGVLYVVTGDEPGMFFWNGTAYVAVGGGGEPPVEDVAIFVAVADVGTFEFSLVEYDMEGNYRSTVVGPLSYGEQITRLTTNPATGGVYYLHDTGAGEILITAVHDAFTPVDLQVPSPLAFDSAGFAYASVDDGGPQLVRFNPDGLVPDWSVPLDALATAITVGPDDTVYVVYPDGSDAVIATCDGTTVTPVGTLPSASAVATLAVFGDALLTADSDPTYGAGALWRLDSGGVTDITPTGLEYVAGVATHASTVYAVSIPALAFAPGTDRVVSVDGEAFTDVLTDVVVLGIAFGPPLPEEV